MAEKAPPIGDLDALLDDALADFDTEDTRPQSTAATSVQEPRTQTTNTQAVETIPSSSAPLTTSTSAQNPKKGRGGLAFDPLGNRQRTSKADTVPKHPPTTTSLPTGTTLDDDDADDDVDELSLGLSKLLAELVQAQAGGSGAGEGEEEDAGESTTTTGGNGGGGGDLAATLRALAENQSAYSGSNAAADNDDDDALPDDLLEKFAAQFKNLPGFEGLEGLFPPQPEARGGGGGGSGEATSASSTAVPGMESFVDSIMHSLVSKEVLYQPMKDIGGKYPEWLDSHRESLDPGQLKLYEEQYGYIQQICAVYETDPNNYMKIMELLQEMQERGSPPDEIISELAPNLSFGPDGLPVGLGGGGLGGGGGGAGGPPLDPSECCIQ